MRAEGAYPQGTREGQRSLPEVRDGFYKEELTVAAPNRYIPLNYKKARLNVAAMHVQARFIYFI